MKKLRIVIVLSLLFSSVYAQKEMSIAEVQGNGNISPVVGEAVRLSGIVTARTRTGFFIQTPDDKTDSSKDTSEGIFVFTKNLPPKEAEVGNAVSVSGKVEEYRRKEDLYLLTITELSMRMDKDEIKIISKDNPLPKAIELTPAEFMSNSVDSLERYEGMRVSIADLLVVSPTDGRFNLRTFQSVSDGAFFGVLKPIPRPFREAGRDIREFENDKARDQFKKDFPQSKMFDSNPEILRIDTDEQMLPSAGGPPVYPAPLNVSALSSITGLQGVLHYSYGKYTLLTDPDNKPTISSTIKPSPLPIPTERQVIVASMNLENFFDDQDDPKIKEDISTPEGFARRLHKTARAITDFLHAPDIIGVIEVENLPALKRLADKLNSDIVSKGGTDPKYEAFLIDGNDGRGIDNGFLVKTSRVKVIEVVQFGQKDKYKNPNTGADNFVNDRPPLLLRASIEDKKKGSAFELTVVVNHFKSYLGYSDPKQQDNVRLKKKLQAEFLAKLVQDRQKADPKENIILLGDFNSYQFSDGILDQIGTIKGKPAGKDEVLMPSADLVDPDMINLVDVIAAAQRYSYVYDGNAQVLDHVLITETLRKHTTGFGFARLNVDFPEVFRNDLNRIERFSDHDPAILFLSLDAKEAAKNN